MDMCFFTFVGVKSEEPVFQSKDIYTKKYAQLILF